MLLHNWGLNMLMFYALFCYYFTNFFFTINLSTDI